MSSGLFIEMPCWAPDCHQVFELEFVTDEQDVAALQRNNELLVGHFLLEHRTVLIVTTEVIKP